MRRLLGLAVFALLLALPQYALAAFPGPNGKIVFSGSSDIFSINPDGTGLARLTVSPGTDSQPSWSPDGRRIVFRRDRGFDPVTGMYLMNADGTGVTQLTSHPNDAGAAWSPDGTKIAFMSFEPGDQGFRQIYLINVDGTGRTPVTAFTDGAHEPDWSVDDKLAIGFGTFRQLYVMNPDGTGLQDVIPDFNPEQVLPNWSPDAAKIVFGVAGGIHVVNADGTEDIPLTSDDTDTAPAWSPDGSEIVFSRNFDIWVMNADGTAPQRLFGTPGTEGHPDWGVAPASPPPTVDPKNRSKACKAEREAIGDAEFTRKYGGGANAFGMCVSQKR